MKRFRRFCGSALAGPAALAFSLGLGGCDLAPIHHPPKLIVPDSWEGQTPFEKAAPKEVPYPTDWWKAFNDPVLNDIEAQALKENGSLQAAGERFLQARALTSKIRSELLPHGSISANGANYKQSDDRLWRGIGEKTTDDSEDYGGLASWEPDFWSSIRNRVRMGRYAAQQKAADYALARLSLEAEIARDYIALRGYDSQTAIYEQSIAYFERALKITQNQVLHKAAPLLDVERAKAQLYVTRASLYNIQAARQVQEHALAVLSNNAPQAFHITPRSILKLAHPDMPQVLPSALLERRPDIVAAEKRMQTANRAIGVARAAFFPHISFRVGGGFEGGDFDLAKLANSLWSYGGHFRLPIFEGGLRRAELQRSWAAYREMRDSYRVTVLAAFQEVEDDLSRLDRLQHQNDALKKAVEANAITESMTMNLYQGGVGTYLNAIIAQENTLASRISHIEVAARQYEAEVALIRALGGGWKAADLPPFDKIISVEPWQYAGLHHGAPAGDVPASERPQDFENLTQSGIKAQLPPDFMSIFSSPGSSGQPAKNTPKDAG